MTIERCVRVESHLTIPASVNVSVIPVEATVCRHHAALTFLFLLFLGSETAVDVQRYTFENLVWLDPTGILPPPPVFFDVSVDRPSVLALGFSNNRLMGGRLLLALDALYLQYTDAALFGALFNDQWALQLGAQYSLNDRILLRLGYAWDENPMRKVVGDTAAVPVKPLAVKSSLEMEQRVSGEQT